MTIIGLFGGTFDPIHNAHLAIAHAADALFHFQKLHFIPCKMPLLKLAAIANEEQRCDLIQLAIKKEPRFVLDRRELVGNYSCYTIDTLKQLRQEYGHEVSFITLIGMDQYQQLEQWKDWQALLNYSHLFIYPRKVATLANTKLKVYLQEHQSQTVADYQTQPHGFIYLANLPLQDISSSLIRDHLHKGKPITRLVPDEVLSYIDEKKLYP